MLAKISAHLEVGSSSFGTIFDDKPSPCELELYISQDCLPTEKIAPTEIKTFAIVHIILYTLCVSWFLAVLLSNFCIVLSSSFTFIPVSLMRLKRSKLV